MRRGIVLLHFIGNSSHSDHRSGAAYNVTVRRTRLRRPSVKNQRRMLTLFTFMLAVPALTRWTTVLGLVAFAPEHAPPLGW